MPEPSEMDPKGGGIGISVLRPSTLFWGINHPNALGSRSARSCQWRWAAARARPCTSTRRAPSARSACRRSPSGGLWIVGIWVQRRRGVGECCEEGRE